jgi:hypothetical protein
MMRLLFILGVFITGTLSVSAQEGAGSRDPALEEMDGKLQERRAGAVRARLVLYTDELEKLRAQFTTANDAAAINAVNTELEAAKLAMRQLAAIAKRQAEPVAPGEIEENGELPASVLAARRINKIIQRFSVPKGPGRSVPGASSAAIRQRTLKFDEAARNKDYLGNGSRAYWGYEKAYALWSLKDLAPGDYDMVLRCTADAETGGKAVVKIAGSKFEVVVPGGQKGGRELKIPVGAISIKESGVDVRVESGGLADKAKSLCDLEALVLQPVTKRP